MLVLTRKSGQKVIINGNIEVIILECRGDNVKIGIAAPKEITIYREEIFEEIKRANQQALSPNQAPDLDAAAKLIGQHKLPPSSSS
ncbi:MAG: carbon storage regulator CsrA [Cyanobacteria bacterium]|nr:carbon storage regulator CsrA [Cyanobacteriota bacterium]